jgi:hypothetical protein
MSNRRILLATTIAIAALAQTCAIANARVYSQTHHHATYGRHMHAAAARFAGPQYPHGYAAFGRRDYGGYGPYESGYRLHSYPPSGPYFLPDAGALPVRPVYGPAYAHDDLIVRQENGKYLGTDPDPNIRAQMRHDNVGPDIVGGGGRF